MKAFNLTTGSFCGSHRVASASRSFVDFEVENSFCLRFRICMRGTSVRAANFFKTFFRLEETRLKPSLAGVLISVLCASFVLSLSPP